MSTKNKTDRMCPGGNHPVGQFPALSRYGHGDICSADGTREALYGDFIKPLKTMDNYSAVGMAEGFEEGDAQETLAAWQYISDKGLWKGLQGFFGRQVASLLEQGVIIPSHA